MFGFTLAGLVVGFAVGATGVGGGALMTPILILAFGIVPATAVGTDLLYAAVTKGFGVALHRNAKTVDWRVVGLLAAGSVPATVVTSVLMGGTHGESSDTLILSVLAVAIIVTSLLTLARAPLQYWLARKSSKQRPPLNPAIVTALTVIFGALIGVLVTISSVGAGVIGAMVLMMLYPKMRAIGVVGTDLAHAVPLTLLAGILHYIHLGSVDFQMLGYLLLGSLPGIYLGTKVGFRLPDNVLRPTIAIVLLIIGCSLLLKL